MRTVLDDVSVVDVSAISEFSVVFTISLNDNPQVRNAAAVNIALSYYAARYINCTGLAARYEGDLLFIVASGSIDPDALAHYTGG